MSVDFHCHVCGVETASAPDLPEQAVCPQHCEDHNYYYNSDDRRHECYHCGKEMPHDYYDD